MNRIIFLLVLLPFLLSADEGANFNETSEAPATSLASIYGLPETNVMGVNVIDGDYNYSCVDFDLPGADPLVFQRIYSSSQKRMEGFYQGWTHNLSSLVHTYSAGSTYEECNYYETKLAYKPEEFHVLLTGSLSGSIPFYEKIENKDKDLKRDDDIFNKGITNCSQGHISGRTNIKNLKVECSETGVKVTNPDGTEHLHNNPYGTGQKPISRTSYLDDPYFSVNYLAETIKPNGMRRTYTNVGKKLLGASTLTHDNQTANQIKLEYPDSYVDSLNHYDFVDFSIKGHSKDGKSAEYHIHAYKKRVEEGHHTRKTCIFSMSAFKSNHLPHEYYNYMKGHDGYELLTERFGAHHKTLIGYYKKKDKVYLYGQDPKKVSSDHIARGRVEKIQVAVKNSTDLQTAFRFAYHENLKTADAFTDVYNAQNHLSRYHYSTKNQRLSCVEKYAGTTERSIYRRDRLEYGAKGTSLEGDLLFKTVEGADGTIHFGENYAYDERGNVLQKNCHYKTFRNSQNYSISKEKNPNSAGHSRLTGGEVKSTFYTYNALNLPTSENDGKLTAILAYHTRNGKGTNLLKSKLIKKNQKILKRKFYTFDKNAACTLKIEDDGSKESPEDLTGVKCRRTTRMINREGEFAGLPLEIDVWGSNGEPEQRISRTVLKYDSHGYVTNEKHYDAANQFVYELNKIRDLQGNITSETDALGQTSHRRFNKYGSLLEEHGPCSTYYTECDYDWLQRPVILTRKCSDGIHLTTLRSYDLEGNLTQVEDTYGSTTKMIYDEKGCPVEIIHPPIRTNQGKWIRPRELKQYNFLGHLISETDSKGAVTLYTPNTAGLPLKIKYPDGTFEKFSYSMDGETLEKIQRNGSKTVYAYDDFSRPISEEIYDREGKLLKKCTKKYAGLLLESETDGEGLKKQYTYDYAGQITEIRHGEALTKYVYDSLGRIREEQRYFAENENDMIITQLTYDALNRVIKKKEMDAERTYHSIVMTKYDADGNVVSTETKTHAGMSKTTNTYDPRGNLSSTTDPLGNITRYIHRYDFFFEGKNLPCLETIDPAGVKTTAIYDAHGHVISTQVHSPFGELLSDTDLFYDLKGNLIRKEQHLPTENLVTLYDYDTLSRLIEQVDGFKTEEQLTTTFVYNQFGELSKTRYNDGSAKHRIYDAIGRLSEEWSEDKAVHYRYTYNKQDLLKTALNCNTQKKTTRKYSPEGNLLAEKFENGLEIRYAYDRTNRLVKRIYPDDSSVKQTYNPIFLTKIERIKDEDVLYEANFSQFLGTGKPQNITFPSMSGNLSLEYDLLNRPTGLSYAHYKEEDICYDNRGLLISKRVNGDQQKYEHDFLQQLILEKTALYSHTYVNDALNRQISVDGVAQTHNAVNQLTHGVHDTYKYDAKGRRTHDSTTSYTYDKFDRLIAVNQGNSTWQYTYDAFNRKMSRTFDGKTAYYLYDDHEEIGSYSSPTECLDLKILSAGAGSLPIALELGDAHYSPLVSSQGHIVGLIEMDTGKLADYSPLTLFGKDLADHPLSPWRFCGKRHEDAALGIIDFGYRFYHALSGQWLTQDPLGESDGPNLYAYVRNNPASLVDRFGLYAGSAWEDSVETAMSCWDNASEPDSMDWEQSCNDWEDYSEWDMISRDCHKETGRIELDCSRINSALANNCAENLAESQQITPESGHGYAGDVVSLGLGCVPVVGTIMSALEVITGRDMITGAVVHRGLAMMGLFPGGKLAGKACKALTKSNRIANIVANGARGTAKAVHVGKNAFGFAAQILSGNKYWGLNHIMLRHAAGSKALNASKFAAGIGRNEITELAHKAYSSNLSWTFAENGYKTAIMDTGRIIGTSRTGPSTSLAMFVFDGNKLITAYPYILK